MKVFFALLAVAVAVQASTRIVDVSSLLGGGSADATSTCGVEGSNCFAGEITIGSSKGPKCCTGLACTGGIGTNTAGTCTKATRQLPLLNQNGDCIKQNGVCSAIFVSVGTANKTVPCCEGAKCMRVGVEAFGICV